VKFTLTENEDCQLSKDLNKLMEDELTIENNILPVQKWGK